MKKVRHRETEMVKAIQSLKKETSVEDVTHTYGIFKGMLYNWKSKYSGMDVSQVKRQKELEDENRCFYRGNFVKDLKYNMEWEK